MNLLPSPQRLRAAAKADASAPAPPTQPAGPRTGDTQLRFLLLSGTYTDELGNTWVKSKNGPDVIVPSNHFLDEIFANKFFRLDENGPQRAYVPPGDSIPLDDDVDPFADTDDDESEPMPARGRGRPRKDKTTKEKPIAGDDVTEKFPGADDAKVLVFKDGRHYNVVKATKPGTALNADPLNNHDDVESFIADLV